MFFAIGVKSPERFFLFFGSIISEDGEIEEDVEHRIRAGWFKWRFASGVLCDRCIPAGLNDKVLQGID